MDGKEIARGGLWDSETPLGRCEKMAPWSVCVFVCVWCGGAAHAALLYVVLHLGKASISLPRPPPLHPPPVSLCGRPQVKSPCQEGLSFHWSLRFTPYSPSSWHQLSLSLYRGAVYIVVLYSFARLFTFLFFLSFFNCSLSLDTSITWLTTANCFYLGEIFFNFNWFALCSYICLSLHFAFIFFFKLVFWDCLPTLDMLLFFCLLFD